MDIFWNHTLSEIDKSAYLPMCDRLNQRVSHRMLAARDRIRNER